MLPTLLLVDLLEYTPDADVDLFADDFEWSSIPAGYGCYAFYDSITNEVVYIGSACADSQDPLQCGLRFRLRFYRGRGKSKPSAPVQKVRDTNKNRPLRVKCWRTENIGDCRKYEVDAISLHKPILNFIGSKKYTLDEFKSKKKEWTKKAWRHIASISIYNPELLKICSQCRQQKPCSEFRRHKYKANGVRSACKNCMKTNA